MNLTDLARKIGARVVTEGRSTDHVIDCIYAGDRISDLLAHASRKTLLVTNLSGALLVCVAELMDVPAVCLVGGQAPAPEIVSAAKGHGMFLMISPADLFETCGRVYGCWNEARQADA